MILKHRLGLIAFGIFCFSTIGLNAHEMSLLVPDQPETVLFKGLEDFKVLGSHIIHVELLKPSQNGAELAKGSDDVFVVLPLLKALEDPQNQLDLVAVVASRGSVSWGVFAEPQYRKLYRGYWFYFREELKRLEAVSASTKQTGQTVPAWESDWLDEGKIQSLVSKLSLSKSAQAKLLGRVYYPDDAFKGK